MCVPVVMWVRAIIHLSDVGLEESACIKGQVMWIRWVVVQCAPKTVCTLFHLSLWILLHQSSVWVWVWVQTVSVCEENPTWVTWSEGFFFHWMGVRVRDVRTHLVLLILKKKNYVINRGRFLVIAVWTVGINKRRRFLINRRNVIDANSHFL